MNVLILTDKLIVGGAETYFCKLENQLQHPEMTFYYAAGSGELQDKIMNKAHYLELKRDKHRYNLKRLKAFIRSKEIDLIHANSLRMVLYGIVLKKMTRRSIQLFYTKHNITWLESKYPYIFSKLLNRFVHRIITVSDFEKESLIQCGVQSEVIKTIYNGVDLNQFVFSEKKEDQIIKIGILARLSEEKNIELFVEIADKCRHLNHVKFFIGGDGPEKDRVKALIDHYDLSSHVTMLGGIDKPEDFIREMDVMLLTSKREVFPMVILEAMAVGTPIISIDRGGIKEAIIEGQTGFLVPHHTIDGFYEKMRILISNPGKYSELSLAARERVEGEFSLERMVHETLAEYSSGKSV